MEKNQSLLKEIALNLQDATSLPVIGLCFDKQPLNNDLTKYYSLKLLIRVRKNSSLTPCPHLLS